MNKIDFINYSSGLKESTKKNIINALNVIVKEHKILNPVELTIKFVNNEEIQKYNKEYRKINKTTDVLSFPIFENVNEINSILNTESVLLGDILINLNQAEKQAKEIGQSLDDEILYLSIHSILHLIGYDHMNETEKNVMRDFEKKTFEIIRNYV